ncbi:MAG: bifunctional phosphoribosylaminoimidazolecarboxamide formyltransferase/IMP cyclohydrolase [Acidobacteriaceae bacterium]|nr:bifunctional phosphoribosylaminoimidazolecarboxamide formyltransferase/IMP cyclohydrolase [Acidobacteriaceae bacterium]MBV9499097.1 bifunctional phosphoribosylaminoimidazolecarboxamide formyltransferase/IMP cyclohydrolase [Acidobacteriaceae bacterium]
MERALLSVTDKTGVVDFAKRLHGIGVELISTGGTAKLLRENGIPVREVADVTGFPEMLDGRVKTLHPRIAGGILAVRSNPEHMRSLVAHEIPAIQMVVVNLYQFEKFANKPDVTREELIENIDIGGPTMIRAAAKNFQDVAVVVSPAQYQQILDELVGNGGALTPATHWRLAQEAFSQTAAYDAAISRRLAQVNAQGQTVTAELPERLSISAPRAASLRYGENAHQKAALYTLSQAGIAAGEQLHGKELSYNNLVDLDAAWQLIQEFEGPAAAIIKHTNPCGCAEQNTLAEAYRKALEADPVSAFGGVLAFNREIDEETASEVAQLFVEAIAAPAFSDGALRKLQTKKNLRLLRVKPVEKPELVIKSISGGLLAQTPDDIAVDRSALVVKTERQPTSGELEALLFGWKVCKHVKSNAIVFARAGQTISIGAGQMSRVDSVKVAAMKAVLPLEGTVLASDAFFPFPDGVEEAAKHGITAVIQPGGSVRDDEVVAAANRLNLAMVFTGVRHFRH